MGQMLNAKYNKPGTVYMLGDRWYRIGPRGNHIRATNQEIWEACKAIAAAAEEKKQAEAHKNG